MKAVRHHSTKWCMLVLLMFSRLASSQTPNFHCTINCKVYWILCDIFFNFGEKYFIVLFDWSPSIFNQGVHSVKLIFSGVLDRLTIETHICHGWCHGLTLCSVYLGLYCAHAYCTTCVLHAICLGQLIVWHVPCCILVIRYPSWPLFDRTCSIVRKSQHWCWLPGSSLPFVANPANAWYCSIIIIALKGYNNGTRKGKQPLFFILYY